jgi:cell wall-associated NlpC family hydrolase
VRERGQISVAAAALLLLVVLGAYLVGALGGVDTAGARAQRAADLAAVAAGRALAADPSAGDAALRSAAASAARSNGAELMSLKRVGDDGIPAGVQVTVSLEVDAAGHAAAVAARARAAVSFSARLPAGEFRPVDLHGLAGRTAVVQAAAAQVGWPYVWGGESRAEGGFDCSGLVDYAFAAAGAPLPGRPTAADLWHLGQPISATELEPGDLVFLGAPSGRPYHVGIYVGAGTVLAAPHTGAVVGYSPLAAGGWDGFARLLPPQATVPDGGIGAAARRHGVPPYVIDAELRLGLAHDPEAAAAALERAQSRSGGSLEDALAVQLGSRSAAALVLRDGGGPSLPLEGDVHLVPVPTAAGLVSAPLAPGLPAAMRPTRAAQGRPGVTSGTGWLDRIGAGFGAGEHALEQLGEHGRAAPLQAFAGLEHLSRFTLTGLSALLPGRTEQDAAGLIGSLWDGIAAARDLATTAGRGLPVGGWGLWAARFSLVGGVISTLVCASNASTAQRRRDRIGYGLMAAGSAASSAGMLTAGGSLLALGAETSVVPPVGLGLMAAGAGLCVAGYLVQHPEWCRAAWRAGGRVLDTAWRVQTAPVRVAASAASTVVDGARSVISAIPNPF